MTTILVSGAFGLVGAGTPLAQTALLPTDGRIQTVDVRDVARAFAGATISAVVGEVLMIGGDDSHRLRQGDVTPALTSAVGLEGGIPVGLPGDPARDETWFATDWMDTTRAQERLGSQHHSWPPRCSDAARRRTGRPRRGTPTRRPPSPPAGAATR